MRESYKGFRLLLVHAHPDDETINNGATMALYADRGAQVTLVTCTRGEEGEVLVPSLSHLASSEQDQLGTHRETELADAMKALGISDYRFLGAPTTKFRDSGMMGTEPNNRPDVFWQADVDVAARILVDVIEEVKPHILITYDEIGGYGHPDHIQAHRVTHYAMALAASPTFRPDLGAAWVIAKAYWSAFPRSIIRAGIEALRAQGDTSEFATMDPDDLPFACDDALITTVIEAPEFLDAKQAAMRAHETQISLDDGFFALSNNLALPIDSTEYYVLAGLADGVGPGERDDRGWESDLLSGLTLG